MGRIINPTGVGGVSGLVPTIRATAPVGSTVSCDGQTKVVGAEGFVDFVVSAEPVNILPDGVQGLESIESTGTQYINTGLIPRADIEFIIDHQFTALSGGHVLIGSQTNSGISVIGTNASFAMFAQFNLGGQGFARISVGRDINRHTITTTVTSGLTTIDCDGIRNSVAYTNALSTIPMFLFAHNEKGNATIFAQDKMYSVKASINDSAVMDYIPCTYNNQVGMWDTVSNSFFGNQGTGSFIAGEPKEYLEYPTYTVTVNGISKTVTIEGVELRTVSF